MSDPVIEISNLTKTYHVDRHKVEALRGVNLLVEGGKQYSVVGRSGAGKSTLLHIIGLLDKATSGVYKLKGQDVGVLNENAMASLRNKEIGFVFQQNNLLPEFSALENVMMPGLISGARRKDVSKVAERLLEAVGLKDRLKHLPSELSGGEMQRVAIARSILMQPSLLLADEPTGNLDQQTALTVETLLMNLSRDLGITVIIVTHDLELAGRLPLRIEMADGKILTTHGV